MAINTLATATLFMTQLDKIAVQEATTGWMDANAGQVIYNGGSEVKIPKMSVQGMGDYDREAGYQRGSVTLEYETRKMTQEIRRRNEPLLVGGMYGQGTSHYLVTEHLDGFLFPAVHLRRQDGWELDAVGAALYDTPQGVEIQWDYSLNGRFVPET